MTRAKREAAVDFLRRVNREATLISEELDPANRRSAYSEEGGEILRAIDGILLAAQAGLAAIERKAVRS